MTARLEHLKEEDDILTFTISEVDVGLHVGKNSEGITASADKYKDTTYAVFTLGYSF